MKRIIFTLLYKDGYFVLSRNFKLQNVGNVNWLLNNYKFTEISKSIDELIILNLSKDDKKEFLKITSKIIENIFIPVALGGGIKSLEDAKLYFNNGADKIILNSLFIENKKVANAISDLHGKQSIIASIDYIIKNKKYYLFHNNNLKKNLKIFTHINNCIKNKCGEIMIQSVNNDGTGYGLDLSFVKFLKKISLPIILMGGIGQNKHFLDGLKNKYIDAVSTANIFNFMKETFINCRVDALDNGILLPNWNNEDFKKIKKYFF